MPLAIECFCEDDPEVNFCTLSEMSFVMEVVGGGTCGFGIHAEWELYSDTEQLLVDAGNSNNAQIYEYDIDIAYQDEELWNQIELRVEIFESALQLPQDGCFASMGFRWHIKQTYTCSLDGDITTFEIFSFSTTGGGGIDCTQDDTIKWNLSGGDSAAVGLLFRSSPLGSCNEGPTELFFSGFAPPPEETIINLDEGGQVCVCATGGTPPYRFYVISGVLPNGGILDPETGCISTGQSISNIGGDVTIGVIDSVGDTASVSCNFQKGCCDCDSLAIENVFY